MEPHRPRARVLVAPGVPGVWLPVIGSCPSRLAPLGSERETLDSSLEEALTVYLDAPALFARQLEYALASLNQNV